MSVLVFFYNFNRFRFQKKIPVKLSNIQWRWSTYICRKNNADTNIPTAPVVSQLSYWLCYRFFFKDYHQRLISFTEIAIHIKHAQLRNVENFSLFCFVTSKSLYLSE